MATARCVMVFCCLGVVSLVGGCGLQAPQGGAGSAPAPFEQVDVETSSPLPTQIVAKPLPTTVPAVVARPAAEEYPTLPTAPKDPPAAGKTHLEFGPEMDDVLQKYRDEAEGGAKLAMKAERSVPSGNPRTLSVPVPKDDALRLGRDSNESFHRYRLRDVDAYLAHTHDSEDSKTAGAEFLRAYIARSINRTDAPTSERLLELSQQAVDAGCTDPLVRTYQAYMKIGNSAPPDVIEAELLSTADHLEPYPPVVQVFVRATLCQLGHTLGRTEPERLSQVSAAFVNWLAAEKADPQWRQSVLLRYNLAMSLLTPGEQEAVLADCLRAGTADPWLMHYALGNYYRYLGWHYRGTGFANEVSAEGWRRVQENLPLSTLHYRHAWALDPTIPEAPRQMIFVSGSGYDPSTSPYQWFLRTIAARFDDWDAYDSMLEMLSARWGGSTDAQLAFGEKCLDTNRFDTIVPYISMAAIEKTWMEGLDQYDPERARSLVDKYLEKRRAAQEAHPDETLAVDNSWARSVLAYRMFRLDMPGEAVSELLALGPANVNVRTFQEAGAFGELYVGHQVAKQTVDSAAADELDRYIRSAWPPNTKAAAFQPARKLIEQHQPQATNDLSRRFFKQAERVTGQLEQRSTGEWVNLRFDDEFLGWEVYTDAWVIDTDKNSLRLWRHNGAAPQLRIRPIADFRPPIEVELELEILEPHPYPRPVGLHWVNHHMWMASEWDAGQPLFGIEARLETTESGAVRRDYAVMPGRNLQLEYAALPASGPHKLRLKLWSNMCEFEVDGYRWVRRLSKSVDPQKFLGIGEAWPEHGGANVNCGFQISNVMLRTLTDQPPALP